MTSGSVLVVPIVTLPKLRLAGFGVNCPIPVATLTVTPVPLSDTWAGEFVALLPMESVPLAAPATAAVKVTVNFALWPGAKLIGSGGAARLKPDPINVA